MLSSNPRGDAAKLMPTGNASIHTHLPSPGQMHYGHTLLVHSQTVHTLTVLLCNSDNIMYLHARMFVIVRGICMLKLGSSYLLFFFVLASVLYKMSYMYMYKIYFSKPLRL